MQRTRTRWTTILAIAGVAALIVAVTAPVSAKGKPAPKPADTVTVTMTYTGSGIATTCSTPLTTPFTMNRKGNILRTDWADANTEVEMKLLDNNGVTLLEGCHGGLVDGSDNGFAGYFILAPGNDGTIELTSRFDYYWEYMQVKKRLVQTELRLFEINAVLDTVGDDDDEIPPFDWSPGAGAQAVAGMLELRSFDKSGAGWVSLAEGETAVSISMTIEITE